MEDEEERTRVAIAGACGRMGREVTKSVLGQNDMKLVLAVDRNKCDEDIGLLAGAKECGIKVTHRLTNHMLSESKPHVLVDFTLASVAHQHALTSLENKVIPIIGTSGLSKNNLSEIRAACEEFHTPALFIPNFAIGAVLMMRFAQEAAQYLPDAEILEMHHDGKLDAPSQTAIRTAEMIDLSRNKKGRSFALESVKMEGARGAEIGHVKIHSVRLPGLVAHQMVIFGGAGEVLTIRHDSTDRSSFMPGVLLAIRKAQSVVGLIQGLEKLL